MRKPIAWRLFAYQSLPLTQGTSGLGYIHLESRAVSLFFALCGGVLVTVGWGLALPLRRSRAVWDLDWNALAIVFLTVGFLLLVYGALRWSVGVSIGFDRSKKLIFVRRRTLWGAYTCQASYDDAKLELCLIGFPYGSRASYAAVTLEVCGERHVLGYALSLDTIKTYANTLSEQIDFFVTQISEFRVARIP